MLIAVIQKQKHPAVKATVNGVFVQISSTFSIVVFSTNSSTIHAHQTTDLVIITG